MVGDGKIELVFEFKKKSSYLGKGEDVFCTQVRMVEDTGIEPATS